MSGGFDKRSWPSRSAGAAAQNSIQCNGLTLSYDRCGPPGGPTILLLHAGGESRRVWQPVTRHLDLPAWQVIAPDLRGHGDSERASDYLLPDFVADVRDLIEQLASRPLVIVGSSIGGLVGLLLAGKEQDVVDGLILLDAPTRLSLEATRRESQKVVEGIAQGLDVLAHLDPKLATSPLVDDILAQPHRLTEAAGKIRVPTLLLYGRRSKAIGDAERKGFLADIPHAEMACVDAGHLIARDRPDLVAGHIRRFVEAIPANGCAECEM